MKTFFSSVVAFVMMLFSLIGNPSNAEGMIEIYICHYFYGITATEYKIDLARRNLWEFQPFKEDDALPAGEYKRRDADACFEGYEFAGRLAKGDIEAFRAAAEQYGFADWDETYTGEKIAGGHVWSVAIAFADGTRKTIHGSNAYPETWDEMAEALEALTGINVLR